MFHSISANSWQEYLGLRFPLKDLDTIYQNRTMIFWKDKQGVAIDQLDIGTFWSVGKYPW